MGKILITHPLRLPKVQIKDLKNEFNDFMLSVLASLFGARIKVRS